MVGASPWQNRPVDGWSSSFSKAASPSPMNFLIQATRTSSPPPVIAMTWLTVPVLQIGWMSMPIA